MQYIHHSVVSAVAVQVDDLLSWHVPMVTSLEYLARSAHEIAATVESASVGYSSNPRNLDGQSEKQTATTNHVKSPNVVDAKISNNKCNATSAIVTAANTTDYFPAST